MESDIQRIVSHRKELKHFFEYPGDKNDIIDNVSPSTLHALHSLIRFTIKRLETHHPEHHRKLMEEHGDIIRHLAEAKDDYDSRQRFRHINNMDMGEELYGGSIWGSIGHFFSHAAHSVGHAFKTAGEAIYHHVLKPAAEGIKKGAEVVYHKVLKPVGQYIYKHRKQIANIYDKAIGILSKLPIPYVQEAAQIIKPFADVGNTAIQGTGLIGLAYRQPEFLKEYPQGNLIEHAGIGMY